MDLNAAEPYNLLYIVCDQHSGMATKTNGDPYVRMPNLERLQKQGLTYSRAYTAGMTCGPSRASLHTGLYSQTHGVTGGGALPEDLESLPKSLAQAGYVSTHPNGYSLDAERAEHEKWLKALGYAEPLSSIYGSEALAKYRDTPLKWKSGRMGVAPEHSFEAFVAQRSIRFLEENQAKRFACFVQFRGPHDPYMTPRPYDTMFDPDKLALPPYSKTEMETAHARLKSSWHTQGADRMTDRQIRETLALYYGMLALTDSYLGKVLDRIDELGLAKNTIVVYLADHGDTMGKHRMMSKDYAFFEPAVRIPMVFRGPGVAVNKVEQGPASGVDVFPTLTKMLGLAAPKSVHGRALGGQVDPERVVFAAQGREGKDRAVMLRTRRFKLTRYDDGGGEMYDLERDPDELRNVIGDAAYLADRTKLVAMLEA